jgi:putative ABC transport system permease protein
VREIVMTGQVRTRGHAGADRSAPAARAEIHARVLDGPLQAFPYAIRDGRAARAPGEVTLGRGALDALHARIGDRIALRAGGEPVSLGAAPSRA